MAKVKSLGQLNNARTIRNAIGFKEKSDFYQFSLANRSTFSTQLDRLKANADLQLLSSDRKVIGFSKRSGKKAESIAQTLEAGTYYLQVGRRSGETTYRLKLNATKEPLPLPLTESYVSTSDRELGKLNKQSGLFTLLSSNNPTFLDLAQSATGDLFGVTFSSLYKIDPNSGAANLATNLDKAGLNGLGFAPSGVLYASGGSSVYTVNPSSGATTLVANIPGFNSSGDLAFDAASNRFFATSQSFSGSDRLFSIGLDGTVAEIGSIGFNNVFGLAIDNGVLYGYTADRQQITINSTTGVGSLNRSITGTVNPIYGVS